MGARGGLLHRLRRDRPAHRLPAARRHAARHLGPALAPAAGAPNGIFGVNVWWVALLDRPSPPSSAAKSGIYIGHKGGPSVFERKESGLFSVKNVERTNAFFARFGGLAVILARFVPIVRTFAPVAAGVGHMHKGRYTLYNFIGALLWGFGLTMFGYLIGFIPPVGDLRRASTST